jgi:hypothetical protein
MERSSMRAMWRDTGKSVKRERVSRSSISVVAGDLWVCS